VSQDVTLSCTVSKDDVQLTWKKNGQEIKPDGKKYEVVIDGTVHRLLIHDIQLDDDAEYQCCFGDDMSSCKLHVEGNQLNEHFCVFNVVTAPTLSNSELIYVSIFDCDGLLWTEFLHFLCSVFVLLQSLHIVFYSVYNYIITLHYSALSQKYVYMLVKIWN